MAEKKWFVPAEGSTVFDPATNKKVPPEGKAVEDNVYWRGCVEAKDGTYAPMPGKSEPAAAEEAPAKTAGGEAKNPKRS